MKTLLVDFDGVINKSRYFSEIYSEEFGVDLEVMKPFFETMKDSANIGKADLRELLSNVLTDWQWTGTVDELLQYWFNSDLSIDLEVKAVINDFRDRSNKAYLATDQEKYRAHHIWDIAGLGNWLDGKFFSCELGFTKSDPQYFAEVIKYLNASPDDLVFVDDSKSKVESAVAAGIAGVHFKSIEDLKSAIA